jgi:hypothetical protein
LLRTELQKYLSVLRRNKVISDWSDRRISGGTEWEGAIDENLKNAQIILLLISADFLNSDYCWDVEMKHAMLMHELGAARVVPVVLRECPWEGAPFGKLQALPQFGKPINKWDTPEAAFTNIAKGIEIVVKELQAGTQ